MGHRSLKASLNRGWLILVQQCGQDVAHGSLDLHDLRFPPSRSLSQALAKRK
jgi:hypothetical protein